MSARHIMIDLETAGNAPGSVILSIGACVFDEAEIGAKFYRAIDVASSVLLGFEVNPDTTRWWCEQDKEVIGATWFNPDRHHIEPALDAFAGFVQGDARLWAKGPYFDLVMLNAAYRRLAKRVPWNFRNTRDVHTVLSLADVSVSYKRAKHNALEDAIYQAHQVQAVYRELGRGLT